MDTDETPLLHRHPLQQRIMMTPKTKVAYDCKEDEVSSLDSDTDMEMMSLARVEGGEKEQEEEDIDDDQDIPMTQQIDPRPLANIIVYVEVRSTNSRENRRDAIAHQLEILGATVSVRLAKDVTHVVFKDGKQAIKEKAEKKGMYLVSPLWLEACKRANDRVSEAKYPVLCKDGSDSPVVLGRLKRIKSMQPKPLMEEISKSLERSRKRQHTNRRTSDTPSTGLNKSRTDGDPARSDSIDSDDYELPKINIPGTPHHKENQTVSSVTPDAVSKVTGPTIAVTGKGSINTKARNKGATGKACTAEVPGRLFTCSYQERNLSADVSRCSKGKATPPIALRHTKRPISSKRDSSEDSVLQSSTCTKPLQPSSATNKCSENASKSDSTDKTLKPKKKKMRFQKIFEKQKPSLVLTSVHTGLFRCGDQETVHSIVEKLGRFECSKIVSDSTTHVVCGSPRRTVNILSATLKGCWVLKLDWVMNSLEHGYWLPEDAYEMMAEFPAARYFRQEHQLSASVFRPVLFKDCGSVFVSSVSSPPAEELEKLLALGGGKVTASHRKADVCVGCKSWSHTVNGVSEQWILDSITEHKLLPIEDYLLGSANIQDASPEL